MRLWLDDVREMPSGFDVYVKTTDEAIAYLITGQVEFISLDHDLGENIPTGYDLAKWIERSAYDGTLPALSWAVHSANPVGRKAIDQALRNADKFWQQ